MSTVMEWCHSKNFFSIIIKSFYLILIGWQWCVSASPYFRIARWWYLDSPVGLGYKKVKKRRGHSLCTHCKSSSVWLMALLCLQHTWQNIRILNQRGRQNHAATKSTSIWTKAMVAVSLVTHFAWMIETSVINSVQVGIMIIDINNSEHLCFWGL